MGLLFRRRIKLCKGIYLNLGKSGIGISAGVKGARVGINSRGQKYASIGIPGTGISYRSVESKQQACSTKPSKEADLPKLYAEQDSDTIAFFRERQSTSAPREVVQAEYVKKLRRLISIKWALWALGILLVITGVSTISHWIGTFLLFVAARLVGSKIDSLFAQADAEWDARESMIE